MMEIGRLCMKIAGRDANNTCVVVDLLEGNYVLVDGETRRKKCNIKHLEPLNKVVKIKKGASRDEVKKVFSDLGLGFFEPKSKQAEPRVKRTKVKKEVVETKKPKQDVKPKVKPSKDEAPVEKQ
jgi:large subunit ribosomal protein L14e